MSVNNLLSDPGVKGWANLYVNNLETYNDLTVNGELTVNGTDMSAEETFVDYEHTGNRFTATYKGARLRLRRIGFDVIANIDFINDDHVATQNGTDYIDFLPTEAVPDSFKPGIRHIFSVDFIIKDGAGVFLYYTPGTITLFEDMKIRVRISRIDTSIVKNDSVADGLRFRTEFTPITYFTGAYVSPIPPE